MNTQAFVNFADKQADYFVDEVWAGKSIDEQHCHDAFLEGFKAATDLLWPIINAIDFETHNSTYGGTSDCQCAVCQAFDRMKKKVTEK